tara:strand:- start:198 stop:665 length:468 start_codon:yes stop_codon:yes gene_type:complete
MEVTELDFYDVHIRYGGIVDCLSDGFGPIQITREVGIPILLNKIREGHTIMMTIVEGEVVATATGFVERKIIHAGVAKYKAENGASSVMHIEDVATRTDKRGNGYGAVCVKALHEVAKDEGCYKIILDASIGNFENFYAKLGYKKTELCLRKNIK